MDIKFFYKPTKKEDEWEIYVTDADFDTYSIRITSIEPPSAKEMEEHWKLRKQYFQLLSYVP